MAREPELIAAADVERIVAERVRAAEERLAAVIAGLGGVAKPDAISMDALAMAIATLTDQGTGRKRIAPEEMTKRDKARERMTDLIEKANRDQSEPAYKLRHIVYLGERRVNPAWIDERHRQQATEIGWYGVPNEAMEPMNDVAKAIYAAFEESIGAVGKRDLGAVSVTASGLAIIKGAAQIPEAEHTGQTSGRGNMAPTIRGRGAPAPAVETNILGTIMPPARQVA